MLLPTASSAAVTGSRRPGWPGWLLIAPLLVWLAAFVVAPFLVLVAYSLAHRGGLGAVEFGFTLEHYGRAFEPVYLGILGRSVGYAAITTALCLLAGFPVAWFIARRPPVWRNRLLLLVMVPFWTSFLIRTYAWISILKTDGLLNATLLAARVTPAPLEVLYTPAAVLIGLVYAYLPFMILPIYASAEKLDPALVEAAHDLGAGPLRVFAEVIGPLTRPGIAAGVLLVFVPSIGMFAITDLLGGARVQMIGNVIQNQFSKALNFPFVAALGVVFTLLFLLALMVLQRLGRRFGA